jgi:hypothetical protein
MSLDAKKVNTLSTEKQDFYSRIERFGVFRDGVFFFCQPWSHQSSNRSLDTAGKI